MIITFTICSNNYLAHAKILGKSLKKHEPALKFIIFLCDEKNDEIDYSLLADEVIPLHEIEPRLPELALKYNIVELNTCMKPRAFEYLFNERKFDRALFFDPDTRLYNSLSPLFDVLENSSIILTPHICSPIPFDDKNPTENHFLNFGIYNLGFIALQNCAESLKFIGWWKGHTYSRGYIDVYKGIFVDQLPMNLAPVFFKNVNVIKHPGCNMAPWNLHERQLDLKDDRYMVNESEPLIFFHFSSFRADVLELPLSQYDRFTLQNRPDIYNLYKEYNEEIKADGYYFYTKFTYRYAPLREAYLNKRKRNKWAEKIMLKKFFSGKKK